MPETKLLVKEDSLLGADDSMSEGEKIAGSKQTLAYSCRLRYCSFMDVFDEMLDNGAFFFVVYAFTCETRYISAITTGVCFLISFLFTASMRMQKKLRRGYPDENALENATRNLEEDASCYDYNTIVQNHYKPVASIYNASVWSHSLFCVSLMLAFVYIIASSLFNTHFFIGATAWFYTELFLLVGFVTAVFSAMNYCANYVRALDSLHVSGIRLLLFTVSACFIVWADLIGSSLDKKLLNTNNLNSITCTNCIGFNPITNWQAVGIALFSFPFLQNRSTQNAKGKQKVQQNIILKTLLHILTLAFYANFWGAIVIFNGSLFENGYSNVVSGIKNSLLSRFETPAFAQYIDYLNVCYCLIVLAEIFLMSLCFLLGVKHLKFLHKAAWADAAASADTDEKTNSLPATPGTNFRITKTQLLGTSIVCVAVVLGCLSTTIAFLLPISLMGLTFSLTLNVIIPIAVLIIPKRKVAFRAMKENYAPLWTVVVLAVFMSAFILLSNAWLNSIEPSATNPKQMPSNMSIAT
ncbi:uncharacterized protein NEMAJ01_1157 [Nematocida major]|uniref:uncharacterized protein n=1 Tax=Nematocida major TaxID=1912982 RepID=UPI002008311C|nr:uncharacterized protein NEMAJ01_1157 [Nematocida major]KAH9386261.1 hypothetical protein NEMAJ01_1157 [Nematocida major]